MPTKNITVIALTALVAIICYSSAARNRYANIFAAAMDIVEKEALIEVAPEDLFSGAMTGMLSTVDENSGFITGLDYELFQEDLNQEFVGVGMTVHANDEKGCVRVISPIPGTPAFAAGMQAGDLILEIDGNPTPGLTHAEAIDMIRGPRGVPVDLLVERTDVDDPFLVSIVRDAIPVPSINGDTRNADGSWNFYLQDHPRMGYVRLRKFGERSTEEMKEALDALEGKIDAFILDLRDNPGGLLSGAVDVSDMFIDREVLVVMTKKRNDRVVQRKYAKSATELDVNIPMVVLVNGYSASAAEIVAACLQDHKRATVVGTQTYGKGTVQDLIQLQHGRSILRLTTASYWRPSGRNIDRTVLGADGDGQWGVLPDEGCDVNLDDDQAREYYRARNERDQTVVSDLPTSGPAYSPWLDSDLQLRRAVELLQQAIDRQSAA